MHIPEAPRPLQPNTHTPPPQDGRTAPPRPPQPSHPEHAPGIGDALAPPDISYRPPAPDTPHRLGAIGVPQAAAHQPADKPQTPTPGVPQEAPAPPAVPQAESAQKGERNTSPVSAPEVSPTAPEAPPIPNDIREGVGNILRSRITESTAWPEPDDIKLYLEYGPPEGRDDTVAVAESEAELATYMYTEEIASFVGSTPDTGIPRGRFEGHSTNITATYRNSRESCAGWLAVTAEHAPEANAETLGKIIQTLEEHYDPEQFAQAIRTADDPETNEWRGTVDGMERAARRLAEELAHTISAHADDPVVLGRFLSTAFVQDYGSARIKNMVDRRIIDLGPAFDPANPAHTDVVEDTKQIMSEGTYTTVRSELQWLLRHDPQGALDTLDAFSASEFHTALELERSAHQFISEITPDERTESQQTVLDTIESREYIGTLRGAYKLHRQLEATGSITPEDARSLVGAVLYEPIGTLQSARADKLICAFLPLGELTELRASGSYQMPNDSSLARALAVRRYAAAGQLDTAQQLARSSYNSLSLHTARNLLAIYDETNDPQSLERARGILGTLQDRSLLSPETVHETILAQHMTAHKYGDQERIDATWRDMEVYLGPNIDVYTPSYERLVRAHLDVGSPERAETHAVQFKERLARETSAPVTNLADNALLNVADAYRQQGRYGEVARIVRTHFLSSRTVNRHTLQMALDLLQGKPLDESADLYPPNVNALHELRRPY